MQLSLGSVQDLRSLRRNFQGCLENPLHNDLNLIELAKHGDPQVTATVRTVYSSDVCEYFISLQDFAVVTRHGYVVAAGVCSLHRNLLLCEFHRGV